MTIRSAAVSTRRMRDADRTRQAILQAATDEFSERGFGGARMDAIGERASVNKRLVYYYFKSKEALFLAVLEQTYRRIRDAEKLLQLGNVEPADAVRRLVEFTWDYYLKHPEFLTLLNIENLHRAEHIAGLPHIRQLNSPLVQMLAEILERGRASGVFRGGIDPVQLYISIAALAYFYLSNRHTLSAIFGRNLISPKARSERLSHMTDVVLGYVLRD